MRHSSTKTPRPYDHDWKGRRKALLKQQIRRRPAELSQQRFELAGGHQMLQINVWHGIRREGGQSLFRMLTTRQTR